MDSNVESETKNDTDCDNKTSVETAVKSHVHVNPLNRIKQDDLRSTKSSPFGSVELHHTRSFSEICHLHPSRTDVTCVANVCPRPRALEELQHEVRRPESVLEMADLPTSSDDESDEDAIATEQQKGDEAMKIFLESNVSVPLDGNMTSSSLSQDTLDSDFASESELIVGNWEREGRDSIASTGSSLEKRFLTPSGQLLYREHQVDSMLDTKRLKLTPSSSERPMSPLAMRRSDESMRGRSSGNSSERRYRVYSDSESEEHELTDGIRRKNIKCDCDLRLEDLQKVILKYERECEELINRSKEQYNEIKTLRKDNSNMHKEHKRLQLLIKECQKNENSQKENTSSDAKERDDKMSLLGRQVRELGSNLQDKNSEISKLQCTIDGYKKQGEQYIKVMQEILHEIKALFQTLAKELGFDGKFEVDSEENPEAIIALLKTRRKSLSEDLKNCYENLHPVGDKDTVSELHNRMREDFQQLSSGYQDTISKIQKAEKDLGKVVKRSASLETLLQKTKGKHHSDEEAKLKLKTAELQVSFEAKLKDIQRRNDSLMRENKTLREDCCKWKRRLDDTTSERNEKRKTVAELKPREEKELPSAELGKLQKYLRQRRKSYSETNLLGLQQREVGLARVDKKKVETKSNVEVVPKLEGKPTTVTKDINNFEGVSELENRLKQLSKITEDLTQRIEKSNQSLVKKTASSNQDKQESLSHRSDGILSAFYGVNLFSVMKEIYENNLAMLQDRIIVREKECHYLKEQLLAKENNEEMTQCYVKSLKRAVVVCQENIRDAKNKNQNLKKELRILKDRILVTNTEREISLFYCKKNSILNDDALIKHEKCSDTKTLEQEFNDIIEETS